MLTGRLGESFTIDEGQKASQLATINLLATLRNACGGDLDKVKKIVKVVGFVNSAPNFTDQAKVMNGNR